MARAGRIAKGCGIGCGGVVALLVVVAAVLAIWKPWAPEITVADPGPGGQRVTEGGMLGNYYPAKSGAGGAVLVIGGSEGGLNPAVDAEARALSEAGISALALSYWGGPDQPERMEDIPLETFDSALTWLGKQPGVDGRLGVLGTSKGGEASMLIASRHPELKAVVGNVPSHVVWQGFDMAEFWRMFTGMSSTWSAGGRPVPYLPYASGSQGSGELVQMYRASLAGLPQHPEAVIPVEKSKAPLLLVCGESDTMWPSCDMSREIEKRARSKSGPPVTVLAYRDAGHAAGGPPMPHGQPIPEGLAGLGGTPEGNAASRTDSWPRTVDFLRKNLAG